MSLLNHNQISFLDPKYWKDEEAPKKPKQSQIADLHANRRSARRRSEGWARKEDIMRKCKSQSPENILQVAEEAAQKLNRYLSIDITPQEVLPDLMYLTEFTSETADEFVEMVLDDLAAIDLYDTDFDTIKAKTKKEVDETMGYLQGELELHPQSGSSENIQGVGKQINILPDHAIRKLQKGDGLKERRCRGRNLHNQRPRMKKRVRVVPEDLTL